MGMELLLDRSYIADDITINLCVAGRVDGSTRRRRLAHFLRQQQKAGMQRFMLDLSGAVHFDDMLMGFFIVFQEEVEAGGGEFRIISSAPYIDAALEACGMTTMLTKPDAAEQLVPGDGVHSDPHSITRNTEHTPPEPILQDDETLAA